MRGWNRVKNRYKDGAAVIESLHYFVLKFRGSEREFLKLHFSECTHDTHFIYKDL